jgi:putative transcriptional regulator
MSDESLFGRLLVATPMLFDPNFVHAVVLLVHHDDTDGAVGLILNRPSTLDATDHLPGWAPWFTPPSVVFSGGPVDPAVAVGLGRGAPAPGVEVLPGGVHLVDLGQAVEELEGPLEVVRIFSGYSGWNAGQLEAEIDEGSWFVVDAVPDDPFTSDPDRLFRNVLRRQRGRLRLFADHPLDPSLN